MDSNCNKLLLHLVQSQSQLASIESMQLLLVAVVQVAHRLQAVAVVVAQVATLLVGLIFQIR
jgi:hypothetical protein